MVRRQATFLSPCASGQIIFHPYYHPGIEPRSPTLWGDSLPSEPQGKPKNTGVDSRSLLQGIFLTQALNRGLLHCRWIIYQLSYQALVLIYIYIKNGGLLGSDCVSGLNSNSILGRTEGLISWPPWMHGKSLQSCPTLCDPIVACQSPLSVGFSRQEYWSGLPFPPLEISSHPKDWTCISRISYIGRWILLPLGPLGKPVVVVKAKINLSRGTHSLPRVEWTGSDMSSNPLNFSSLLVFILCRIYLFSI